MPLCKAEQYSTEYSPKQIFHSNDSTHFFNKKGYGFNNKIVSADCFVYCVANSQHITGCFPLRFCITGYLYTNLRATDVRFVLYEEVQPYTLSERQQHKKYFI